MSRTIAIALAFGLISTAALAAPQRQLVAPNLSPGLRTVPFVPSSYDATASADTCDQQLINRIDSGTVIAGPDGLVAHLTGMASGIAGGSDAKLVITSMSPDGSTANADFVACRSAVLVDTTAPVATSMVLAQGAPLQSIIVRAQANSMVLYTSKAH
jgi:hypothetical protein